MAFGDPPSAPDYGAMLALNNFKSGGGSPLLCLLPGSGADVKCFESLSSQGKGFNADAMLIRKPNAKPSIAQRIGSSIRDSIAENFKKANADGAAQQTHVQQVDMASITGQNLPRGGDDFGRG